MRKGGPVAAPFPTARFILTVLGQEYHDSLFVEGWMQGRPCQVTINTGTSVTNDRSDIGTGRPEIKPGRAYVLEGRRPW
jgi:hypothetical protein